MLYDAITQFLDQNYQVLMLRIDRSKSINAASARVIAWINPILQHILIHEFSKTGHSRRTFLI
jgi:hypothetical protein